MSILKQDTIVKNVDIKFLIQIQLSTTIYVQMLGAIKKFKNILTDLVTKAYKN